MKAWLRAAVVAMVLSVGLGGAQAQVTPQAPARAPDAPKPKPKAAPPRQTPAPPLAVRPPDPALTPQPNDTTARITGYANDPKVGGAQCRTQCANVYYTCLSTEDATPCGQSWNQCLAACPKHSSNF